MDLQNSLIEVGAGWPVDSVEKVTGNSVYTSDIRLPGAARVAVLRSPFPHARIRRISAEGAARMSGVLAVLTQEDLKGFQPYYGPTIKDQPTLAIGKVRYEGEPVAAVAAVDLETAEEALRRIEVEYEELPAVLTVDQALDPGAPMIHDKVILGDFPGHDLRRSPDLEGTNICLHAHFERGDFEEGLRLADEVFEDTFELPKAYHYALETHSVVAHAELNRVTVWSGTQHPFPVRQELSQMFGLPLSRIRVVVPYVGGAYGSKNYTKLEPLAVALSMKCGRPVQLTLSHEESLRTVCRPGARCMIKTGVQRDGTLVCRQTTIHLDTGAYADAGPRVTAKAAYRAPGPYRIPHVCSDAYAIYTNTIPAGAFRGFGTPQVAWAYESQMDIIAERLGMDPLEIRLKNLLDKGEAYAPGELPVDCDLKEGLRKVAAAIGWDRPATPPRGKGISCIMKDAAGPFKISNALIKVEADASVLLLMGTVDLGQGPKRALARVAAEVLGMDPSRITVAPLDTDSVPYDLGTNASSGMTTMGLAVQRAAQEARDRLAEAAAQLLGGSPSDYTMRDGRITNGRDSLNLGELMERRFQSTGGVIIGTGTFQARRTGQAPLGLPTLFWEVGWAAAEVEVDRETGQVKLLRYVSASDVGHAVQPVQCRGQEEGSVLFGIGGALFEQILLEEGRVLNAHPTDYRVPTFADLPEEMECILIEDGNGPGPLGSKGMAEGGVPPAAPAIANAIARATGLRIRQLPITPERLWTSLVQKKTTL